MDIQYKVTEILNMKLLNNNNNNNNKMVHPPKKGKEWQVDRQMKKFDQTTYHNKYHLTILNMI